MKNPDNALLQEVLGFVKTLELVLDKILKKVHAKKKRKKSEKETFVEAQLQSLQSLLAHLDEEGVHCHPRHLMPIPPLHLMPIPPRHSLPFFQYYSTLDRAVGDRAH